MGSSDGGPDLRAIQGGKSKRAPFPSQGTAAEKADWYLDQKFVPIPIAPKTKRPGEGWNVRTADAAKATLAKDFADPDANVGVLLGGPSGGLADVDFDCAEVVKVGGRFLPRTPMSFGRQSAPRSHAIYRCPKVKTEKFFDPRKPADQDHGTLVEVRSDGCQTVFPGSVHPSGEVIRFEVEPGAPAEVKPPDLRRAVARLAAAALLGRYWPGAGRHEAQLALAGGLLEAGWDDKDADHFLCAVCFLAGDEDADKRHRTVVSTRERLDAGERVKSWPQLSAAVGDDVVSAARKWLDVRDGLVRISGDLRRMVTSAEQALAKEGGLDPAAKIYVRGNSLVRVEFSADHPRTPLFAEVPDASLQEVAAAHLHWVKSTKSGDQHVLPPKEVIAALRSRGRWPTLRQATQVTECPLLRPDGTVLDEPGFDDSTKTLYLPNANYPRVPERPTTEERGAALELVLDALADFPFASLEHRSAALAAALTPAARSAIEGPVPLFLFEAPDGGTGKDLCARTCGLMSTGQQPASETFTEDVSEMRKRITSHAIGGSRVVLLGNVEGELGGAPLEDALTLEIYSDRLLGKNVNWRGPLRTTFYASQNNATIGVTMARRICPIRLDAKSERPDRRRASSFRRSKRSLLSHARSPEFVVALLILLRAYVAAGCPDAHSSVWGSYEEWSGLVVGAIRFAGLPDPGEARDELAERADPRAEYTRQFVTGFAWLVKASGKLLTAKQAIDLMDKPGELVQADPGAREQLDVLRNAAVALLRVKTDELNQIQLGILLRRSVGKVRDGVTIHPAGYKDKTTLWGTQRANVWDEISEMDLGETDG